MRKTTVGRQAKIFINILIANYGKEVEYTGECLMRHYVNTTEEYFGYKKMKLLETPSIFTPGFSFLLNPPPPKKEE